MAIAAKTCQSYGQSVNPMAKTVKTRLLNCKAEKKLVNHRVKAYKTHRSNS